MQVGWEEKWGQAVRQPAKGGELVNREENRKGIRLCSGIQTAPSAVMSDQICTTIRDHVNNYGLSLREAAQSQAVEAYD